jgi:hypothetical protein
MRVERALGDLLQARFDRGVDAQTARFDEVGREVVFEQVEDRLERVTARGEALVRRAQGDDLGLRRLGLLRADEIRGDETVQDFVLDVLRIRPRSDRRPIS